MSDKINIISSRIKLLLIGLAIIAIAIIFAYGIDIVKPNIQAQQRSVAVQEVASNGLNKLDSTRRSETQKVRLTEERNRAANSPALETRHELLLAKDLLGKENQLSLLDLMGQKTVLLKNLKTDKGLLDLALLHSRVKSDLSATHLDLLKLV